MRDINVKRTSTTTRDSTQQSLATRSQHISEAAAVQITKVDHLKRIIRGHRQDAGRRLPNPADRRDISELPQEYQLTLNGEQFLLFDSGVGDADRLIIFST